MPTSSRHEVVDVPTFETFFQRAHDDVYRALVLTIGDAELAADAVQEALSKAYQRWHEVGAYANPTGWVYRVALNWSRSWFRRRARELALVRRPDGPLAELPEPTDPTVSRAVRALPLPQRSVVILRLYLDWSVAEVATALDVSPGTVKSRLARALARLREHLEVES